MTEGIGGFFRLRNTAFIFLYNKLPSAILAEVGERTGWGMGGSCLTLEYPLALLFQGPEVLPPYEISQGGAWWSHLLPLMGGLVTGFRIDWL